MALIYTAVGLINREELTVKDIISEDQSSRVTATEWYLGDKLVRRDVNVNVLNGVSLTGDQGGF